MRSTSVKPSQYPPLPFHTIRFFTLLCAVIVASILAVFAYNLHIADRKLPWAFLVLLISAFIAILNIFLTTLIHCCYGLSPRLSLTTNGIVLLLWSVSFILLAWSMSHTILTTCTTTYWGTATGITVCRIYKALFTFTTLGVAFHISAVILDVVVRRRQTRLGEYDPMMAGGTALADYKTATTVSGNNRHDRNLSTMSGASTSSAFNHPTDDDRIPLVAAPHPHHRHPSEDVAVAGYEEPSFAVPPPYSGGGKHSANASLEQFHAGEAQEYSDWAPLRSQRGGPRVRFSVYDPPPTTAYDPTSR